MQKKFIFSLCIVNIVFVNFFFCIFNNIYFAICRQMLNNQKDLLIFITFFFFKGSIFYH